MNAIRKHHLARTVSLTLVAILLLSVAPLGVGAAFAQGAAKSVLVFPLSSAVDGAPGDIGERAATSLALAVSDVPGMEATAFVTTSPTVRRAVSEGRVRQVDVEEAGQNLGTALMIGHALKVQYVVTGTVQSLNLREGPVVADIILAGQMYEVAANLNPDSGEPVSEPKVYKAFGVSGSSTARARYQGSNDPLVQEALRDAAQKAAQALGGRVVESAAPGVAKKSSSGSKWVIFALLLGGLALALNSSGGGDGNAPAADAYPPRNVALEEQDGSIRITWDEPTGTTLTLLRYTVERSVDGSAFARVDPGNLSAGSSLFTDFNTLTGRHAYQYRIRALYTSGDSSAYAYSGALVVTR